MVLCPEPAVIIGPTRGSNVVDMKALTESVEVIIGPTRGSNAAKKGGVAAGFRG